MRIILNASEGASVLDLIPMLHCANHAIAKGLSDKPGSVMAVNFGDDPRNTYGIVRTKGGVSVWPPTPSPALRSGGDAE